MEPRETFRDVENLRFRFQMNNRLRLECLAAVSKVFRDFDEPIADDLLANLIFAVPQELVSANGNGHAHAGIYAETPLPPESPEKGVPPEAPSPELEPAIPPDSPPPKPGIPPDSPKPPKPGIPPDSPRPGPKPGIPPDSPKPKPGPLQPAIPPDQPKPAIPGGFPPEPWKSPGEIAE